MAITLSTAAKPLISFVKSLSPHLKRYHGERKAGKSGVLQTRELLDLSLEETLDRLAKGNVDDAWWTNILNHVTHKYITPDFLRIPALQIWLKNEQTQKNFIAIAKQRIMGNDSENSELLERLKIAYSEATGEIESLASGPIEVVEAILLAGYFSRIDKQFSPIIEMVQAGATENRENLKGLHAKIDNLGPDQIVIQAHTEKANSVLNQILKKRTLDAEQVNEDIRSLVVQIQSEDGDLKFADKIIRSEILYWAARLHTSKADTLDASKSYLDQLIELDAEYDIEIINALIHQVEGDSDKAFQILRDIDTADGRSSFFNVISKSKGEAAALAWFDDLAESNNTDSFTAIGWWNIAVHLTKSNRCKEAIKYLSNIRSYFAEFPDLAFLEGVVNAAMMLPDEHRSLALEMNIFDPNFVTLEGEEADTYREKAKECFKVAISQLSSNGLHERAKACEYWRLWLRLVDPAEAEIARQEIIESLKDPSKAVELIHFAYRFNIEFEMASLARHLVKRKQFGGLNESEINADFIISEKIMSHSEFAKYLESNTDRLKKVIQEETLYLKRIEALLHDKQITNAERLFKECRDILIESNAERVRANIILAKDGDPQIILENLYSDERNIINLKNLVNFLNNKNDWPALEPLMEKLFDEERTLENANKYLFCMVKNFKNDYESILFFLESIQDLLAINNDLKSTKADILFCLGRLAEAQEISSELINMRGDSFDLTLEINIAIQLGDIERFPEIIIREWPRREELSPDILLRLATLAAEVDITADRAIELVKLAAAKSEDNPNILLAAFVMSLRLGKDDEAEEWWLKRVLELSNENGPVWQMEYRSMVEDILPKIQKNALNVGKMLIDGDIPIHIAARKLNQSLTRFFISIPERNKILRDSRERTLVPAISGARQMVTINPEWTIGIDITSLLLLSSLDLIETLIQCFEKIAIAPDTMIMLLNEKERIKYHQPSLVYEAKEAINQINQGNLQIDRCLPDPPANLENEIETSLAQLFEAARVNGGFVVHSGGIYKDSSYLEQEAELGNFDEYHISVAKFCVELYSMGYIDSEAIGRANNSFVKNNSENLTIDKLGSTDRPIYFSHMALSQLHKVGLFEIVFNSKFDFYAHPETEDIYYRIVNEYQESEKSIQAIEKLRKILRKELEIGKVIFSYRNKLYDSDRKIKLLSDSAPTIAQFIIDTRPCDAVCIDDRYLNKSLQFVDNTGKSIPLLCTLDIIRYLENKRFISSVEKHHLFHKLRQAGFFLIPIEPDEMEHHLRTARIDSDGNLIECAELRTMRQYLMLIQGRDILQNSVETPYLDRVQLGYIYTLSKLWSDESLPIDKVISLSNWIWKYMAPYPLDWSRVFSDVSNKPDLKELTAFHIVHLCKFIIIFKNERQTAFRRWIEQEIILPLLTSNPWILNRVVDHVKHEIDSEVNQHNGDDSSIIAELLIDFQPKIIRKQLFADEKYTRKHSISIGTVTTIRDKQIESSKLFAAVREMTDSSAQVSITDINGYSLNICKDGENLYIDVQPPIQLNALKILSPSSATRISALEGIIKDMGPTANDHTELLLQSHNYEISDSQAKLLFSEMATCVAHLQLSSRESIKNNKAFLENLFPSISNYYERFCGPLPHDVDPESYLTTILPAYRMNLLAKDLAAGLDICLYGALRDDLLPGEWTLEFSDEDMWQALDECNPWRDPFALLGALDIALYRQNDERFFNFSEQAIALLVKDEFMAPNGTNIYEILPLFAELAYNHLNTTIDCTLQPPFWRRLCAWMQAGFVSSIFQEFEIKIDEFGIWVNENRTTAGDFKTLLDLRHEPNYQAAEMTDTAMREMIFGRLLILRERHKRDGRSIPISTLIDDAIKQGDPIFWFRSGPLEGHSRLSKKREVELLQAELDPIAELITNSPVFKWISGLTRISQSFNIPKDILLQAKDAILALSGEKKGQSNIGRIKCLAEAGMFALSIDEQDFSRLLSEKIVNFAGFAQTGDDAVLLLQAIIMACNTIQDEEEWAQYLEKHLYSIAVRLPAGEPSKLFLLHLRELKKVLKMELGIHIRAEAMASAAN